MSIADVAILAKLKIRKWDGFRKDNNVSAFVEDQYNANGEAGNYNMRLVDKASLKPIDKIASKIRVEHVKLTHPWCHEGVNVLPNTLYLDHTQLIRNYDALFLTAVDNLCAQWPIIVSNQRSRLGDLFDPDLYYSVEELRSKYELSCLYLPVSEADHFILDIEDTEKDKLRASLEKELSEVTNKSVSVLYERVNKLVSHMYERLSDPQHKFKNTIVTNIDELVSVMPKLNMFEDPVLTKVHDLLKQKLCGIDPANLRTDYTYRQQIADEAASIANMIGGVTPPKPKPAPAPAPAPQNFSISDTTEPQKPHEVEKRDPINDIRYNYDTPSYLSDAFKLTDSETGETAERS